MNNIEKYRNDYERLIKEAEEMRLSFIIEADAADEVTIAKLRKLKLIGFTPNYEIWYSEALAVVKVLLVDRLIDFISLYKNEKRKEINNATYTISDALLGIELSRHGSVFVGKAAAFPKFQQQIDILKSVEKRFSSSLFDISQLIQADLFDNELEAAKELNKKGFTRGAGAIAGVVLEKHLHDISASHGIKLTKKHSAIADLNDLLKSNEIIEVANWRFIQHLGDLRNLCDHNKDKEPTYNDVNDLIEGVAKVIKTIF